MRHSRLPILAVASLLLAVAAPASADGPYEPNEIALTAAGPLTADGIQAAMESAGDVDWFKFYAKPRRRVYLEGKLASACAPGGVVRMQVYDAEPALSYDLGFVRLTDTTSKQDGFRTYTGHRYFVKVSNNGCSGVAYSLKVTPSDALRATLVEKAGCTLAKRRSKAEHKRYLSLRAKWRRAHGARKKALYAKLVLEQQLDVSTQSRIAAACLRRPVVGTPFS